MWRECTTGTTGWRQGSQSNQLEKAVIRARWEGSEPAQGRRQDMDLEDHSRSLLGLLLCGLQPEEWARAVFTCDVANPC